MISFHFVMLMHFYLQLDVSLVLFILVDWIIVSYFISSWHKDRMAGFFMHLHASWLLMSVTNALKRIFRKGIVNKLKIRIQWWNGDFFYYRKHPNTSLHLFNINFTIWDRHFQEYVFWESVILSPLGLCELTVRKSWKWSHFC
jgi:hypothetical protein